MQSLEGKTAIITGATSGVGLAISLKLIGEGVKTYLIGRSFKKLEKTYPNFENNNKINFVKIDFEIENDVNKLIEVIGSQSIDILIHSAGIISYQLFENETLENFDKQYHINVKIPFLLTQKFLPNIIKAKGIVVFINSTAGLDPKEYLSQYSASKHALKALSKSLHKELLKDGVKISNLYLGATNTPMQEEIQKKKGNVYKKEKLINTDDIAEFLILILKKSNSLTIPDITFLPNI